MWDRGFPRFHRGVALQHEPLRANASKREQVHFLRYYGSVQVASYESPYLHHKEHKSNPVRLVCFFILIILEVDDKILIVSPCLWLSINVKLDLNRKMRIY